MPCFCFQLCHIYILSGHFPETERVCAIKDTVLTWKTGKQRAHTHLTNKLKMHTTKQEIMGQFSWIFKLHLNDRNEAERMY